MKTSTSLFVLMTALSSCETIQSPTMVRPWVGLAYRSNLFGKLPYMSIRTN